MATTQSSPKRFSGKVDKSYINLLCKLYKIRSCSKYEQEMVKFVQDYVNENVPEAIMTTDTMGNILITKGVPKEGYFYPCVAAHMDIVSNHSCKTTDKIKVLQYVWKDGTPGTILACAKVSDTGIQSEIGGAGDDKNGVFVCLEMLKTKDVIKVALFVQEEIGCVGARFVDPKWFDDCSFALECDRKGNSDLIVTFGGKSVISDEFESLLIPIAREYGYKKETGSVTDVMTLKTMGVDISVMNYSSGYYNAHTCNEYTIVEELMTSLNLCSELIDKVPLNKRYDHVYEVYKAPVQNYNRHDYSQWDAEDRLYNNKNIRTGCTCTEKEIALGLISPMCNVCNPVITSTKTILHTCSCGKTMTRRKYSFNCDCGKHSLQIKNYLSRQ